MSMQQSLINEVDQLNVGLVNLIRVCRYAVSAPGEGGRRAVHALARPLRHINPSAYDKIMSIALQQPPAADDGMRRVSTRNSVTRRAGPAAEASSEFVVEVSTVGALLSDDEGVQWRCRTLVQEYDQIERLSEAGLAPTRSVLFSGPPGVGKTETARWIASQLRRPLYVINLATIMGRLLGQTGHNLAEAFAYAASTPCVLLIDELDALGRSRESDADVGEARRVVTVLLQQLDAWPSGHLLIGASNHAHVLDRAIVRRFEDQVEFARPSEAAMARVIEGSGYGASGQPMVDVRRAEVLPYLYAGTSYAELLHGLGQLRRASILDKQMGDEAFARLVRSRVGEAGDHSPEFQKKLVLALIESGESQRGISRLTGVSRNTIRKLQQGG